MNKKVTKWLKFPYYRRGMKVVGRKPKSKKHLISIRIEEDVFEELNKLVKETGVPRQRIIQGILRKVFSDPRFVLDVKDL